MQTNRHRIGNRARASRQRGAAQLFITLVLLGVIMMLGITATIISSTQFKLAGNLQFESQAFDNAEASAAAALSWLTTTAPACNAETFTGKTTGFQRDLPIQVGGELKPFSVDWDNEAKVVADGKKYFIQYMGKAYLGAESDNATVTGNTTYSKLQQEGKLFRITARGTSAKGTARLVQSNVYVKNGC